MGSLLGFIRDLMGFENTSIAFYDMPDLMDEMIEYMCEFNICMIVWQRRVADRWGK